MDNPICLEVSEAIIQKKGFINSVDLLQTNEATEIRATQMNHTTK